MKIVFVNPPLTWEERYNVKRQSGGNTPPLGLACLAAVVRQKGYEAAIIDAAVGKLSLAETAQRILESHPDIAGFTSATIAIDNVAKVMELLHEKNPSLKMVVGGAHITAVPEETFKRYGVITLAVLGEGEATIVDLLDFFAGKSLYHSLNEISGLVLRQDGCVVRTPRRERIKELDTLPYPAWGLLPDIAKYYVPPVHTIKRFPAALLVTSRGCPGQCIFCDRSVFGNWCSFYSAGYVIGMVRELHSRYGVKEIQFRDDNFVVFKKRLVEFCRMIIAERIDIVWSCAGRVDDVDTPTLRLMKQAGCWQIWYGIESGSDEVLKADKKNSTVAQAEEAVRLTDEAGISACGFFIVGHPKETEQDIKKTIDMILRLRLDDFHISYMVPFPGSELYLRAEEFGVFRNNWKNLSGWTSRVFIPYGLTQEALEKYSKEAFFKFYMRPRIILQYLLRVAASRHVRLYFDGFLAWLEWVTKRNRYQFAR